MSKARGGRAEAEDFGESIFARLQEELWQTNPDEEGGDVTVFWCGARGSGKTSLVDRFINPGKEEKELPKPTTALDYKFARYNSEASGSKVLAHFYDLGGDENNDDLLAIPISPGAVCNLACAITVDLSEPHSVVDVLDRWLALLRAQAARSLDALAQASQSGAKRVEALKASREEVFAAHPDAASVNVFPVQLVIFATKWDQFAPSCDPEKRKGMARALRHFAHVNGGALVVTSLGDKAAMSNMRNVLRSLLFGAQLKGSAEQTDPNKPLCVLAGRDSLQSIGPVAGGCLDSAWQTLFAEIFPDPNRINKEPKKSEGEQVAHELTRFPESSVDSMIEQRLEELQQYRKQVERSQRLASEGIHGGGGGNNF